MSFFRLLAKDSIKSDLDQGFEVLDVEERCAYEHNNGPIGVVLNEEVDADKERVIRLPDADAAQFPTSAEVWHYRLANSLWAEGQRG